MRRLAWYWLAIRPRHRLALVLCVFQNRHRRVLNQQVINIVRDVVIALNLHPAGLFPPVFNDTVLLQ